MQNRLKSTVQYLETITRKGAAIFGQFYFFFQLLEGISKFPQRDQTDIGGSHY